MKLGLGLYKSLLNDNNFEFAKQAGATHLVVHLVDYFNSDGNNPELMQDYLKGWGVTKNQNKLWEYDQLIALKKQIESHGLKWEAIENFDPSHWYDILLDGPKKDQQLENLKYMIRNIGKAGIPILGYYFSLAGVWGWSSGKFGRGNSNSVVFDKSKIDSTTPIPNGMIWNMVYDPDAPKGTIPPVETEELWQRFEYFLSRVMPIAEENNVRLVAHPDDPPLESLRGSARLIYKPELYDKLLSTVDSPSNGLEFCMGTIQEMANSDVYESLDKYSKINKIGYIHFRNVVGKVPHYREAFVDEGDIDMLKALKILKANDYQGILIPDHTPEMNSSSPWHTGMAFAIGYMKAALQSLDIR